MNEPRTARPESWDHLGRAAPAPHPHRSAHATFRQRLRAHPTDQRKDRSIIEAGQTVAIDVEQAIETWGDAVYRLALCRMGNRADADDVFQTVFLKLCERSDAFHDDDHLKAWLLRVTITSSVDALRSPWRHRQTAAEETQQVFNEASVDREEIPFPDTETASIEEACLRAVSQLSEKQRVAVHLHYFEGYPIREIARITGENATTVRSHLHRARKALRAIMESEEDWYL